jgi:hypothetical protein
MAKLLDWIRGSGERKRERVAREDEDRRHLSGQEQHEIERLRQEHRNPLTPDVSPDREFGSRPGT